MFDQDDEKTQPWFYDIADFAAKFRAGLLGGKKRCCPTCGRWNQLYRRNLNSAMCRQLLIMLKAGLSAEGVGRPYIHTNEVMLDGTSGPGDFSKLKHWALIEQAPHVEGEKKSSGYWRLTPAGVKFATGHLALQPVAVLLNDELIRFEGEPVRIHTALGKKFNYLEIMGDDNAANQKRA